MAGRHVLGNGCVLVIAARVHVPFIDDHREAYGVEPICKVLPIAPSTYHDHVARRSDQSRLSAGGDGIAGRHRGKTIRTTVGDQTAPCPLDRVNRQFRAPRSNVLRVIELNAPPVQ